MPNKTYALAMARYNLWQNQNLLTTTDTLPPTEISKDRGAFFGSIQRTFSHVLWGDMMWLSRFEGTDVPKISIAESTDLASDWTEFRNRREAQDKRILNWAQNVDPAWFEGITHWYSGAAGREFTKPNAIVTIQMFNHQTHHRGQIHAMLTAAGAKPAATDIPFMPEQYDDL